MTVTFIHHSCFLVETRRFYYLFDYDKGTLPQMDPQKSILVLSSHGHGDHYNPEIFPALKDAGMQHIRAVLSDDIAVPAGVDTLQVSAKLEYLLDEKLTLTTFRSTDLGVAFLIEDEKTLIYHAGDLNDWVWEEETDTYNWEMTQNYHTEIQRLRQTLQGREIDTAFVVLDPRQEKDYDRGLLYFLETIPAKLVYPMHYWGQPSVIETFLKDHPQYQSRIQRCE